MSGCQNFCICETDSAGAYREKSNLALNLDKDDFVLGGYAVDSAKYPLKPRPKGRGRPVLWRRRKRMWTRRRKRRSLDWKTTSQ